jgi:heptosyltransferase-2
MQDERHDIVVWLPSPMGDAILCTPALRSIRQRFHSSRITLLANPIVRQVLSPSRFNDRWLEQQSRNPFAVANKLKKREFAHAVVFKNSFGSALAVFLARIPSRIGYAREKRGILLTDKLHPEKLPNGKFKPVSMIDYYLAIAFALGGVTTDRRLELSVDPDDSESVKARLPEVITAAGPLVIFVPGGAFGPSKCWPSERFARTADRLIEQYNATVVVSVSPHPEERKIAAEICDVSKHKLVSLADKPVSVGELKALFSNADLVITNDTGPRHIAIALQRKVVTLFGPNDPVWTETDCADEIKIVGTAPCAPCQKPRCRKAEHLCMKSISVQAVCNAAQKLLGEKHALPRGTAEEHE